MSAEPTNDTVCQMAKDKLAEQAPRGATGYQKNIVRLSRYYEVATCKPAVAFNQNNYTPHDHGKKRVGQPRKNWAAVTMDTFWTKVVMPLTPLPERWHLPAHYNPVDQTHRQKLKQTADLVINGDPRVLYELNLSGP